MKPFSAIREIARQQLRDEFQGDADQEFADDELDLHINKVLVEISNKRPYEVKETVESDGTREIALDTIKDLTGDKVIRVEYPTGNYPPSELKFSIFGNTLTLESKPTSGEYIYLYCHKVHQVTESASTLSPDLEEVLIEGVVASAGTAFLNNTRKQIVPSSMRLYQAWVDRQSINYQISLNQITRPKAWEF